MHVRGINEKVISKERVANLQLIRVGRELKSLDGACDIILCVLCASAVNVRE
jgi:hypothetical protein